MEIDMEFEREYHRRMMAAGAELLSPAGEGMFALHQTVVAQMEEEGWGPGKRPEKTDA